MTAAAIFASIFGLSVVIVPGTANAATSVHAQAQAATPRAGKLRIMSSEEYVRKVGVATAEAHGIKVNTAWLHAGSISTVVPSQGPLSGHPDPWWTILAEQRDGNGIVIPIRQGKSDAEWEGGDSGAGFNHACADHNFCNENGMKVALSEHSVGLWEGRADRYEYEAVVVDQNLDVEAEIIVAASRATQGFGDPTPDGLAFGLVTAYCDGYTDCPEWVNSV